MAAYQHRDVTVGPAALDPHDAVLDLGPGHPSTHGGLRLRLTLDGDTVVAAEPEIGFMHRGAEKLFEVRDYRAILALANRHDWLSAFASEVGVALLVERMLGLEVPPRATWLRTLLSELNRALASLAFLSSWPQTLPAVRAARERLQAVFEEVSGGRVHFMYARIGGLREDVPAGWTSRARAAVDRVREDLAAHLDPLMGDDGPLAAATRGVGRLDRDTVLAYGVSGAPARASGLDLDLRRDDPYLSYADLGFGTGRFPVPVGEAGDCLDRYRVLLAQVHVSLDLAQACLDRLPAGPVNVRLPKTVRAPEGAAYGWTENPLGVMGYYLVSHGERTPWRLAMRTASFNNVAVLPALLPGTRLGDLAAVLSSLFFVVGDLDR